MTCLDLEFQQRWEVEISNPLEMCHIQVKLLQIYIVMFQYLTNILVNCNLDYSVKEKKKNSSKQ